MDAKGGTPTGFLKGTGSAKMLQSSGKSQMKVTPQKSSAKNMVRSFTVPKKAPAKVVAKPLVKKMSPASIASRTRTTLSNAASKMFGGRL